MSSARGTDGERVKLRWPRLVVRGVGGVILAFAGAVLVWACLDPRRLVVIPICVLIGVTGYGVFVGDRAVLSVFARGLVTIAVLHGFFMAGGAVFGFEMGPISHCAEVLLVSKWLGFEGVAVLLAFVVARARDRIEQ